MIPGLVSVILPVFNRPGALREAVGSVVRQTYPRWELWIVDDGSTDDTAAVAEALASRDSRIRCLRQQNAGPGAAREAGRCAARGEFLQYLDSDDLIYPRKLEAQVAALRDAPEAGIAYCRCVETDPSGRPLAKPLRPSDRALTRMFPTFLACRWWNTLTPLYRSELCHRAGEWLPLFQEEDWEYDARVAAIDPPLAFVNEELAEARSRHSGRLSGSGLPKEKCLQDRAVAHERILVHAMSAGLGRDLPEMQHFARELFLLARQCGAAGLPGPAQRLFQLAREASTPARAVGLDFRGYRALAGLLGWRWAGWLSERIDRLRRSSRG